MSQVFYVKNFGAVGDGITNDAKAINSALEALIKCEKSGAMLVFEPNKTYYYKDNGTSQRPVMYFRNNNNICIKGDNSTLLLGGCNLYYLNMEYCQNVTIEGLNFDYAEYKPAFYGKFCEIDAQNGTAVMIADRDIHLENGEIYGTDKCRDFFACIDHPKSRWHMYVSSYEMLDCKERKLRVNFSKTDKRTMDRLKLDFLFDMGLIMMMPYSGNNIERAFSVHNNTNFTMRNCNIYSASKHGFSLQYNYGEFLFENVRIVPSEKDKDLHFVSWGDMFHLLQNRAHYAWKNCTAKYNYDDVFNISVSLLVPNKVYAPNEVDLLFKETGGSFAKLLPGDKLTFIDVASGKYLRTEIFEVVKQEGSENRVIIKDNIEWLAEGRDIRVYVDSLGAKGAVMENCHFDGTFRARNEISFINTFFHIRRFWIGIETMYEGSLSKNILFKNCTFEYDDENEPYWEFTSHCKGKNTAHLENIVFENCKGADKKLMICSDEDEIIFK